MHSVKLGYSEDENATTFICYKIVLAMKMFKNACAKKYKST